MRKAEMWITTNLRSNDPANCRWGVEGVLTAFERGDVPDWRHVFVAYRDDTAGEVRAFVKEAFNALEQGDIRPELASVFRFAVAPFDTTV